MKFVILLSALLVFSSCDKLKKMEEGMQATREGMKTTAEGLRKQKLAEASKIMLDENNRRTLSPIPSNMMSAARAMGEAIFADEMLLWAKNYLIKVNEEVFADTYPLAVEPTEPTRPTEPTAPVAPTAPTQPVAPTPDADGKVSPEDEAKYKEEMEKYQVALAEYNTAFEQYQKDLAQHPKNLEKYESDLVEYNNQMREYRALLAEYQALLVKFMLNKSADLQMITLVSGFLPESTLQEMINTQAQQGAYRDVLFAILKMRVNFYNDVMLEAGLIGGDKKLETIGQIEKAIEYGEKLDFVCKLEFANQIKMKITGFSEEQNENLSAVLDKELALKKWKKIQEKTEKDFKAQSFSKDPLTNENEVKLFAQQHQQALAKIKAKLDSYK
jgi:hypothetical protein